MTMKATKENNQNSPLKFYIDRIQNLAMLAYQNQITVDQFHVKRLEVEQQAFQMEGAPYEYQKAVSILTKVALELGYNLNCYTLTRINQN